jgi:hypothetical protein
MLGGSFQKVRLKRDSGKREIERDEKKSKV